MAFEGTFGLVQPRPARPHPSLLSTRPRQAWPQQPAAPPFYWPDTSLLHADRSQPLQTAQVPLMAMRSNPQTDATNHAHVYWEFPAQFSHRVVLTAFQKTYGRVRGSASGARGREVVVKSSSGDTHLIPSRIECQVASSNTSQL